MNESNNFNFGNNPENPLETDSFFLGVVSSVTSVLAEQRSKEAIQLKQPNQEKLRQLLGTPGNETLVGTEEKDVIYGLRGDDTIFGKGGDDTVFGGKGADRIYGGKGDDILNGQQGDDLILGDLGNDTLNGGKGDDILNGGSGNDYLSGDKGRNIVTGGAGADVFRLVKEGYSLITDFDPNFDKIELDSSITGIKITAENFNGISQGVISTENGEVIARINNVLPIAENFVGGVVPLIPTPQSPVIL